MENNEGQGCFLRDKRHSDSSKVRGTAERIRSKAWGNRQKIALHDERLSKPKLSELGMSGKEVALPAVTGPTPRAFNE